MKYLVYFRPPQQYVEILNFFRLGNHSRKPRTNVFHCTLMAGRFDRENEEAIVKKLSTLKTSPLEVKIGQLDCWDVGSGSVLVARIQKTERLQALHNHIIHKFQPYINWEETPSCNPNDEERKKVYKKYGSQFYSQFYQPHITIAKLPTPIAVPRMPSYLQWQFKIDSLLLSRKDQEWSLVHKFDLSTSLEGG